MSSNLFATRREMVKFDKHYVFTPTEGMKAFAYADGKEVGVLENQPVSAGSYSKDLVIFKKAPKEFTVVEVLKEVEITVPCRKFGLGDGVKLKIVPEMTPRSIMILLMKLGKTETVGNENVTSCTVEDVIGLLEDSLDEAVDRTGGQITDEDYFEKLKERVNRTGDFADFRLVVVSASKNE